MTLFEREDVEYCIILDIGTSIEKIAKVCTNIRLPLDTTIVALIAFEVVYPIGSIPNVVTFFSLE